MKKRITSKQKGKSRQLLDALVKEILAADIAMFGAKSKEHCELKAHIRRLSTDVEYRKKAIRNQQAYIRRQGKKKL
jgi:hypothetical protein